MVAGDECAEKLPLTPGQIQRRHVQVMQNSGHIFVPCSVSIKDISHVSCMSASLSTNMLFQYVFHITHKLTSAATALPV